MDAGFPRLSLLEPSELKLRAGPLGSPLDGAGDRNKVEFGELRDCPAACRQLASRDGIKAQESSKNQFFKGILQIKNDSGF